MTHPYTPFGEVDFSLIDQRIFYPRRDPQARPPAWCGRSFLPGGAGH